MAFAGEVAAPFAEAFEQFGVGIGFRGGSGSSGGLSSLSLADIEPAAVGRITVIATVAASLFLAVIFIAIVLIGGAGVVTGTLLGSVFVIILPRVVEDFTADWPEAITVGYTLDQSEFIFDVLGSLQSAILNAIALVMIVA